MEEKLRTVYLLKRTDKPDDGIDIYIGSTSLPLSWRLKHHRYNAKNFINRNFNKNDRLYVKMREVGVYNWKVVPLLSFTCNIITIHEFERVD